MILVCGATGQLGSLIVTRLRQRDLAVRALVRPRTDASLLEALGVEIARGDLRDPASLAAAVSGVSTVISTANTIGRVVAGEKGLTIRDVDDRGHASLIQAAEDAGVERFVFVSFSREVLASRTPFARAKLATEARLEASGMRHVIVRPEMFQEIWLSELTQFDWRQSKLTIFGKGQAAHAYVAVDDVAAAMVELALADDPPSVVTLGGPERLTRVEAAEAFERATGRTMKRSHVPRLALRVGSLAMRPFNPVTASLMGQSLAADTSPSTGDDAHFRSLGIEPKPVSRYIEEIAAG
jgi:NADH dehydrogenase